MKQLILSLLFFVGVATSINAQTKATAAKKKPATKANKKDISKEFEMKQYFFVMLKVGPKRDQDSITAAKIQEGHMAHLTKMYNEGKMDLAGPMMDKWETRGICVYNVATMEEVKALVEQDPAIVSGRLVAEIHPWYAGKGSVLR